MKKLKLALGLFSFFAISVFCQIAAGKIISLDNGAGKVDYHGLEKLTRAKWANVFKYDQADSFRINLGEYKTYFLAPSVIIGSSRSHCQFDFYNEKYQFANGIQVKIKDAANTNVCNWIEGVSAVAYKNQPALLVTVQYHRGIDPTKTVNEIGNNYHDFTALLVLDPHPDGSLAIWQDNECLGAMNQIGELAIAKKRLTECSQ